MLKDFLNEKKANEISNEIGYFLEQCKQYIYKDLRPWTTEFIGDFKLPQWNVKHLEQRVTTNLLHYRTNYLIICLLIFSLQLIFSPLTLISLIIISLCIFYVMVINSNQPIVIGEVTINEKGKRFLLIGVISIFLFISGILGQLIWSAIYCIILCLLHALFRPRTVSSKSNKAYEEYKLRGFSFFTTRIDKDDKVIDPENPDINNDMEQLQNGFTSASVRKRQNGTSH
jgi:hypothetical protein